jgi:hypothetical protein
MKRSGHKQIATVQLYIDALGDADERALDALKVARDRARKNRPGR